MPVSTAAHKPESSHRSKVEFYNRLKINREFDRNNYALVEQPSSDDDDAIYRFATPMDPLSALLYNLEHSKNIYKLFYITIVFKDMSHKEAHEYCSARKGLEGIASILKAS